MTEAIYIEVTAKKEELKGKRRVSVGGMLKHLGVSTLGYNAWFKRLPSERLKRKERTKEKRTSKYMALCNISQFNIIEKPTKLFTLPNLRTLFLSPSVKSIGQSEV